jgi:hypothetical protein
MPKIPAQPSFLPVFIFSISATLVVFSPMNSSRPAFSQHEPHTLCELCSSSLPICALALSLPLSSLFAEILGVNFYLFFGAQSLFHTLFHSCRNKSGICHSYKKQPGCPARHEIGTIVPIRPPPALASPRTCRRGVIPLSLLAEPKARTTK